MLTRTQATPAASMPRGAGPLRATEAQVGLPEDAESRRWIERLGSDGPEHESAVAELHELLLKGARFEVRRRAASLSHFRGGDQEDLAQQSADDALVSILRKLDDFRGESRFTTWAYKFALYEAAAKVRRRAWQGRELPLEDEVWPRVADSGPAPEGRVETGDLLAAVREEIDRSLTPHQREVLVALALNEVPIDVLAERLSTTRGALYKALHDARKRLREALAERGLRVDQDQEENR